MALPELGTLRNRVYDVAVRHGLDAEHADDVVLATHEVCKNCIRFAGGGTLSVWIEGDTLICEVADQGRITELLVGRGSPAMYDEGGRGLWLANQLCDLVQIRVFDTGTVVRLHLGLTGERPAAEASFADRAREAAATVRWLGPDGPRTVGVGSTRTDE